MEINKQYIVNEANQRVAVQLDIATFEKIENVLENYALAKLMVEDDSESLNLEEAKEYYTGLDKV
ncbi:MAG: hypothetical protein EPN89_15090 [Methylovulum sp.]|nr:MAG: hypothetical protein EPN89_15090 [Methylovulum sp.]